MIRAPALLATPTRATKKRYRQRGRTAFTCQWADAHRRIQAVACTAVSRQVRLPHRYTPADTRAFRGYHEVQRALRVLRLLEDRSVGESERGRVFCGCRALFQPHAHHLYRRRADPST